MTRLCIVAQNAAAAVFPAEGQRVGGTETRAWTMARGLSRYTSLDVTLHVRHSRTLPATKRDGVEIDCQVDRFGDHRRYVSDCVEFRSGLPKLQKFRFGLLWRVPYLAVTWPFRPRDLGFGTVDPWLASIACDAFVTFGVNRESSRVVATAHSLGKPVIVCLQTNRDLPSGKNLAHPDELSIEDTRAIFEQATIVIAQSEFQADQIDRQFKRSSVLLRNPIDLDRWKSPGATPREYVLWIGRADRFHKRPLRCLEIARSLPEIPFLMVMNPLEEEIEREVRQSRPPNVTVREYVPHDEMPDIFSRAKAFLSTSDFAYEGFPNVFLQAAATGTPIVTMFDVDGFVSQARAGAVAGESISSAVEAVSRFVETPPSESERDFTRSYLVERYDLKLFCGRLQNLVDELLVPPLR